jgi:uncharacterized membrane protein YfcA
MKPVRQQSPQVGLGLDMTTIIQQVQALIDQQNAANRAAVLAEVDKKGEEAKNRALIGGLIAGFVGAILGVGVGMMIKRK